MAQEALRHFGLNGLRSYRVRSGNNNRHWFAGRHVLRRYRDGRPVETIEYEHAILDHLAERGWPVAAPVAAKNGERLLILEGGLYAMFPRLRGKRGDPNRPRNPRRLGRLLAELHRDLATCEAAAPPGTFAPILELTPTWLRDVHSVDELLSSYEREEPEAAQHCRATLNEVRALVLDLDTSQFETTLIHGDWHAGNLLFQRGEVTGILDFDFAHPDLRVADLAISGMLVDEDAAVEMINGYLEVQPLPEAELDLLNLHERARCVGAIAATLSIQAAGGDVASDHNVVVDNLLTIAEQRWPSLRRRIGLR